MVCVMDNNQLDEEMDVEVVTSMWPEDINEAGSQFNVEKPMEDQEMMKDVPIPELQPLEADLQRLLELRDYSEKGSSQSAYLLKHWEYRHSNAVRLLKEELDSLSKQRQAVELKKLEILEEHRFDEERYVGNERRVTILDDRYELYGAVLQNKDDVPVQSRRLEIDAEYDTVVYWRQRAKLLEKLLEASMQSEQVLTQKLQESIQNMETQSTPVEELSQMLTRADNFMHFILQNSPIVIAHMDKDLRYRFIYNHFPSFKEEDIIGKTDTEIFSGAGVKESLDFKREVLERGLPGKREITFETELFGAKTFLIYVEPVFNRARETIGVNYIGMDITDQVKKREKMAKLREEIAVQKAMETELNKTIHITEETMRAKQMLATMSHEIRSPLSGVVSMAEILTTTKLDLEQRQLLDVMLSSGDLVLQLINDILDLSKVESGVMKLEATKFRPREVVKHVLQTAAASLKKMLTLEGHVADDVPTVVIGDVLRIRQILTNLVSNAIKFTHEGKVGIKLYVVLDPIFESGDQFSIEAQNSSKGKNQYTQRHMESFYQNHKDYDEPETPVQVSELVHYDGINETNESDRVVWMCCDVYDTGIGIPENALPTLFKRYTQVSADHARKYGGTGLGLAICKQLVELMGGYLTVSSEEHCGSTFTFVLPYTVSFISDDQSDDADELTVIPDHNIVADDETSGHFQFQPMMLGSLFSSGISSRSQDFFPNKFGFTGLLGPNGFSEDDYKFLSNSHSSKERASPENRCSVLDIKQKSSESHLKLEITVNDRHSSGSSSGQCAGDGKREVQNSLLPSSGIPVGEEARTDQCQETHTIQKSDCSPHSHISSNSEVTKPMLKPKILLVEDNKINVMVTQSMMRQLGHDIYVVNNGVEAVQAVQRCSYDLILMDVCMPVMDGLQATRIIRSYEETGEWDAAAEAGIESFNQFQRNCEAYITSIKRTPIIAMTANALSDSAEECFANGMDTFVSKPVTFQKLKQCLEQYLS